MSKKIVIQTFEKISKKFITLNLFVILAVLSGCRSEVEEPLGQLDARAKDMRFRLVFEDQFDGPGTAKHYVNGAYQSYPESCYGRRLKCVARPNFECPPEVNQKNFAKLNQCVWGVDWNYNGMDQDIKDKPQGPNFRWCNQDRDIGVNELSPFDVFATDGTVRLTATNRGSDVFRRPDLYFCRYTSGSINSRPWLSEGREGFQLKPGMRLDIRARPARAKGTWPALWMRSNDDIFDWPYTGEIDLVEYWANEQTRAYGTLHTVGVDPQDPSKIYKGAYIAKIVRKDSTPIVLGRNNFITYSVEWDFDQIRWFSIPNPQSSQQVHIVSNSELSTFGPSRNALKDPIKYNLPDPSLSQIKVRIPTHPMFIWMNTTIAPMVNSANAQPEVEVANTVESETVVDWVRVYEICSQDDRDVNCKLRQDLPN